MSAREAFLQRVRHAVIEGNRAGSIPPLPERLGVGYQGCGPNPVQRFCDELRVAGGQPHLVADHEATFAKVLDLVRARGARKIVLGRGGFVDRLDLAGRLAREGLEVTRVDRLSAPDQREPMFGADLGISNVEYLIAETGTVVLSTKRDEPRSLSLLPPIHIAVAERGQVLPDLFDLFACFAADAAKPPSCLTLITGPSKTGDIELRLVTGVHGPGEIHVVLCEA